jgi:Ca-activated chloride channel family protein
MIFRFAYPAALLLLFSPIVLAVLHYRGIFRTIPAVMRYSDIRLLDGLPVGWRVHLRRMPDILRLAAWVLLVFALARPQGGRTQDVIRGQGIDIVLALDISGSMSALDFAPQNRLDAAKAVISNFIGGRDFDRIGLVVFARDAFQQTPPTLDYSTLLNSLADVQLATTLKIDDGTAIGMGIASAGNMLRTTNAASKVVILLTDGANNAGSIGPLTAAQAVAALGIRVYTIGMGKPGLVPMPIDDAGNTQLVEGDLDERTLYTIAQVTGGQDFRAEDVVDLQHIYDEIDQLERSDVERQVLINWQEQSFGLLFAAFALLIGERLLRHSIFQTVS